MKHLAILAILFGYTVAVSAAEPFSAVNEQYFQEQEFNPAFTGKLVAIEGQIKRIEKGPKDKPLFELTLPQPVGRSVWIGSLVFDKDSKFPLGSVVRVLGYLQETQEDDEWFTPLTDDTHHILGFCFLNINTKKGLFLPSGSKQCEAWQSGKTLQ